MPIPMTCDCGRSMRVKDEAAGRKIRCPGCSAVLTVPKTEAPKDVEDEALSLLLEEDENPYEAKGFRSRDWDEPAPRTDSLQPPPRRSPPAFPRAGANTNPALSKPAAKRKLKKESGGGLFNNVEFRSWIAIPGLIMMLVAVLWFVAGLMAGFIFFYPFFLFFIGGGAFFRGITRNSGD